MLTIKDIVDTITTAHLYRVDLVQVEILDGFFNLCLRQWPLVFLIRYEIFDWDLLEVDIRNKSAEVLHYRDVPPHEFSAAFEKKIEKLKKRADHPYFYKTLHKAAAVILAVLIGGSAWLVVDTEARAVFFGWVKEVYEEVFLFRFENGRTVDGVKKDYCLTWIPEGYTKLSEDSVGNTSTVVYVNDESEILKFYYVSPPDETFWQVESTDITVEKATVDGYDADILISEDATVGNTIVWMTSDDAGFCISGFFTAEDLIRLAESVCEK